MGNNVFILGAGIGTTAMGFENAGCRVVAAYENDKRAIRLYEKNINGKVHELEYCLEQISEGTITVDILACDFFRDTVFSGIKRESRYELYDVVKNIIDRTRPKGLCFFISGKHLKSDQFKCLLQYIRGRGYNLAYRKISTKELTGLPIAETKFYLIASHTMYGSDIKFPVAEYERTYPVERILEDERVDGFYYNVNCRQVNEVGMENTFLCWKRDRYVESNFADTNLLKIPLVRINGIIRKITHRELARLKSIPDSYELDTANKAWMYRQLVYAPNVEIVTKLAISIQSAIIENPLDEFQEKREKKFRNLFKRYLTEKCDKIEVKNSWDFVYKKRGEDICFKLQIYNSDYAIEKNLRRVCENLSQIKGNEIRILVVGNIVSEKTKQECINKHRVYIWDVKNLIYLFEEYLEIKNEFISLLTYSVDDVPLVAPEPKIFEKQQSKGSKNTLIKRLEAIRCGKEYFGDYENICTEILKNVLGEYLGLWAEQEKSNGGLYRFDLCCKIKNGVNQDFFDTIQKFFNTKYIVFEFKNYKEKITQKEIYTTEKYLYEKALRKVAILISRMGADENALSAAVGCLRESGKLILCLSDEDLKKLIDMKEKDEQPTADFFEAKLDELLIHLEK